MLLAIDLHEDFIDVEGIAVALVPWFQAPGKCGTELDTPKTDRLAADDNTSFS